MAEPPWLSVMLNTMRQEIVKTDLIRKEARSFKGVQYALELIGEKHLGKPLVEADPATKDKKQWWNAVADGNSVRIVKELGQGNGLRITTKQYEDSTLQEKKMLAITLAEQDINFLTSVIFGVRFKASIRDLWVTIKWWFMIRRWTILETKTYVKHK